jgi:MFS family permease
MLGLATGWNISNTGAVAEPLASAYGVGLAAVGLFTTALFVSHLVMQIPGGKASDRFGPRRMGLVGLSLIAVSNAVALAASDPGLAIGARALMGLGTGITFVAGVDYVRAAGGSPAAQGLYGGVAMGGGGLALAVVPHVEGWIGWRAPFATALVVAGAALIALCVGPADARRRAHMHEDASAGQGIFRDVRLYRLAATFAGSFALSVVLGNWVVTLLVRAGESNGTAGAIGSLTLLLGVVSRPLGGWILRRRPDLIRVAVQASVVAGAAGTLLLAAAEPLALAVTGAAAVGLAAGIPFAPTFTGAAQARPEAPATSVGFVNCAAALVIVVGTPLLGLAFSLTDDGRIGFVVVAALWAAVLLVLPSRRELGVAPTAAPESR